jgi:hypothetical protein
VWQCLEHSISCTIYLYLYPSHALPFSFSVFKSSSVCKPLWLFLVSAILWPHVHLPCCFILFSAFYLWYGCRRCIVCAKYVSVISPTNAILLMWSWFLPAASLIADLTITTHASTAGVRLSHPALVPQPLLSLIAYCCSA